MDNLKVCLELKSNLKILRGMHHIPQINSPIPLIIVHGYLSANRVGPNRLFFLIAEKLVRYGFEVYRFDLSGMGESDGNIEEITFCDHVDDVYNILQYVWEEHNGKKIGVIAHCLGSSAVLANVTRCLGWLREVILLAPYYTTKEVLMRLFAKDLAEELVRKGYTYRKGLYADASFFMENTQESFLKIICNIPIEIYVIVPMEDQYIPFEVNKRTFEDIPNIKITYIGDADHNFLGKGNEVVNFIVEFLTNEY